MGFRLVDACTVLQVSPKGRIGTSMGQPRLSPARQKRAYRRRLAEEAAWRRKNGPVVIKQLGEPGTEQYGPPPRAA
jgi:hypothetical protein